VWWGQRGPGSRVTKHDRLLMLALAEYEADLCEGCGHPRSESMNAEHDGRDPEHVARYEAGAPFECLACAELARAQRAYASAAGGYAEEQMQGLKWVTELVPRSPRKPSA
jgi:hypothetical protein